MLNRIISRIRRNEPQDLHGAAQIAPVDFGALAASTKGMKLNLGCGFDVREGWYNVDLHEFHKPELVCDVTWLAPLEDRAATYVLAQDILEHVHRDRCLTALREWNRVMMDGGLLEIRVPDVMALVDLMREPESQTPERHAVLLQCMFGTQGYDGDFHLNGFTEISLRDAFAKSGFEIEVLRHKDVWLFEVLARKVAHCPPDPILRLESDKAFIEGAYRAYLKRDAEAKGLDFWMQRLADATPREVVLTSIKQAAETENAPA